MEMGSIGQSEYVSLKDTAKLVRAKLKADYPGVKFSVRGHSYSGGASIRISWTDGPTRESVDASVSFYEGATFDGMTDMKSYERQIVAEADGTIHEVRYGADFIFCDRTISPELAARVAALATSISLGKSGDHHGYCTGCGEKLPAESWYVKSEQIFFASTVGCSPICAGKSAAYYVTAPELQEVSV